MPKSESEILAEIERRIAMHESSKVALRDVPNANIGIQCNIFSAGELRKLRDWIVAVSEQGSEHENG